MLVSDAMTPRAETIGPEDTLETAARTMRDKGVGALVVRQGERLVGILTDRDIVIRSIAQGGNPAEERVGSAMTPQVIECCEDDALEGAVLRMERGAVRRLVVLNAGQELVGMLSVDDVALRSPALAGEIVEHVRAPERPPAHRGPWPWWETPES
jgi:CBS domain-containing protein